MLVLHMLICTVTSTCTITLLTAVHLSPVACLLVASYWTSVIAVVAFCGNVAIVQPNVMTCLSQLQLQAQLVSY